MQSKLPVRIKRKQGFIDKKKCYCAQLLKIMIDNPTESGSTFYVQKVSSRGDLDSRKKVQSRYTQTEPLEFFMDPDKKPYIEIKTLLVSINSTLENILHTLQDKKEYLYNRLQEEASAASSKKSKTPYSVGKTKIEKSKKKNFALSNKKFAYAWPEISRLYYGQPPWLKHYMQKFAYDLPSTDSNLIICPRQNSWVYTSRPFSCSDINYFQPMGKMLEGRSLGVSICSSPQHPLDGQGDLNVKDENDIDDAENAKCDREEYRKEDDKEVQ